MQDTSPKLEQDAAPGTRARQRERAPKSPDAKLRGLAGRKLQRQLDAIKATKDAAKIEKAAAAMAALNGDALEEAPTPKPAEQAAAPAEQQPAEMRGTPPGANPSRPGWPSDAAIAQAAPLVQKGIGQLALLLAGTRFAIDKTVFVEVGEVKVPVNGVTTLTEGLTPVIAKYLPDMMTTPEATAIAALVMVFGAPLAQMALEKMGPPKMAVPTGLA